MEFYSTKMGHQFFMNDFPRLVKSLEKISETMDVSSSPKRNGTFKMEERPTEEFLQEAEYCARTHEDEGCLARFIASEMAIDANKRASQAIPAYVHATPEERQAIDGFFSNLTGWTFATILRRYVIEHETESAWKGKEGYILIQASDDGWDYTLYNPAYILIDGGQVDDPVITAGELKDQLVKEYGWDATGLIPTDFTKVEEAVTEIEDMRSFFSMFNQ